MSIVEQAVRRLEELRRSGIEPPARAAALPNGAAAAPVATQAQPAATPAVATTKPLRPLNEDSLPGKSSRTVNIELGALAAAGYLTPETPRARIADEFRVVKRPLLAHMQEHAGQPGSNLVMVSSSLPGEGKTFVSINLAISLAMELDKTVLLVDADVSRPSVLKRLGLPPAPGLLDLLTDPAVGVSDVMLRTNIPKLSLLPAGRPQGRATEILASEAMGRLLEELSTRYIDRIILFDTPPLLPSTESRVLATHMGQVVLVVEADHTPHKTVEQALSTIEQCNEVKLLLNKISLSEVGSYHGYYAPTET